ncbi:MAG: hydrogenase maturation nickel metallochaperone HypA [Alphaproteobacteria bacterium]|nr:hydrogenase maturation nickel metallochaperone HypA [Alphaproteobacteria bacterium]MDE2630634.1 hydrogenase maturation nickel metallochaperone HypA [Alphaproteobacteria bacterium]
MHEASLMKNLMRRLGEIAAAEKAKRITGVSVWLGALSHMSPTHFTEHFEESSAGTIAEGATLDIIVSDDADDDNAQEILVRSVTVDT